MTLDGKALTNGDGVTGTKQDGADTIVEVGSGKYQFAYTLAPSATPTELGRARLGDCRNRGQSPLNRAGDSLDTRSKDRDEHEGHAADLREVPVE